jgi:predicted PurR-regulated permease PerM
LTTNGPSESDAPSGKADPLPEIQPRTRIRLLYAFFVVSALFVLLWFARATLAPYTVGLFFAYLLLPVIRWIEQWLPSGGRWERVKRPIAVSATLILSVARLLAALDTLQRSVQERTSRLLESLPQTWNTILAEHESFRDRYQTYVPISIRNWIDAHIEEIGQAIISAVQGGFESLFNIAAKSLLDSGAALVMVPLFVLYFLLEEPRWRSIIRRQVPRRWADDAVSMLSIVDRTLGNYIRGVVLDSVIVGFLIGGAFWLVGIELALSLGIIAFFGELIPIVGPWIAFFISAPIIFSTQPDKFLIAILIVLAVQIANMLVLVPRIRGGAVDFTSAQTVILLAIGGSLFGSLGLIFVLPVAGMTRRLVVYVDSRIEGAEPNAASAEAVLWPHALPAPSQP